MKNKTIITITLAALLACTAFTGCGKTESTTETEQNVAASQTVETTETETVKEQTFEEIIEARMGEDAWTALNRKNSHGEIVNVSDDANHEDGIIVEYEDGVKFYSYDEVDYLPSNNSDDPYWDESKLEFYSHMPVNAIDIETFITRTNSTVEIIDDNWVIEDHTTGDTDGKTDGYGTIYYVGKPYKEEKSTSEYYMGQPLYISNGEPVHVYRAITVPDIFDDSPDYDVVIYEIEYGDTTCYVYGESFNKDHYVPVE